MIQSSDVDEAILILQGSYCSNSLRRTTSKLSLKRSKSVLLQTLSSTLQISAMLFYFAVYVVALSADFTIQGGMSG
jgi:hypothetical protein